MLSYSDYSEWFTLDWFERWINDGIITVTLLSIIISIFTLFYIYSTFQSQRDLNSITIAKKSYDMMREKYSDVYDDITRNYSNRDKDKHIVIKYDKNNLISLLNELEMVCLLVKTNSMKPSNAFELFMPILLPCTTDQQIQKQYSPTTYTNIKTVSKWCIEYSKNSRIFSLKYRFRGFGWL